MKNILNIINAILGIVVMLAAYWEGYNMGDWVDRNHVSDFPTSEPVFLLFAAGFLVFAISLVNISFTNRRKSTNYNTASDSSA